MVATRGMAPQMSIDLAYPSFDASQEQQQQQQQLLAHSHKGPSLPSIQSEGDLAAGGSPPAPATALPPAPAAPRPMARASGAAAQVCVGVDDCMRELIRVKFSVV